MIIPNERLKHATDQKITFANAFEIADDVLRQAVQSISDLIRDTGFINLDFADVTAIMKDAGMAHMGVGRAAGKGKAEEAARMAISSPLLETSIEGAKGVLINVTGSMDIGLEEVEQAASLVQQAVHPDALTIFGATFDENLDDEIPHSIAVRIDEYKDRTETNSYISATLLLDRESHKGIVIGKGGEMIKKIGQDARREIEKLTGRKIYLELRVKVMKNWRNDENLLRQLGIMVNN